MVIANKTGMRSPCAIANALDILGDRWTLLIIRDLMFTNRREFGHFLNAGEGISTNILTERLGRLQCNNIVSKQPNPGHGRKFVYELTDAGLKLAPAVLEFALWGRENIEGAFVPPSILGLITEDRQALLDKVYRREPLVELEL